MTASPAARSRADAVRNERRLLEAAGRAFAEYGLDISVGQIVREAGLGKGTAFRCFPTKDDLVAAIASARLADLAASARELLQTDDPGAIYTFMRQAAELYSRDRGYAEAMSGRLAAHHQIRSAQRQLLDVAEQLVVRAQRAGVLREDLTAADLFTLQVGVCHAATRLGDLDAALWQRYLSLMFEVWLPAPGRVLPPPGPAG